MTVICEGIREDVLARGIPEEKVTVIPNSVDVELFSTERRRDPELARRLGLEGCEVLGFLGSFYAYEGLELAHRSVPRAPGKSAPASVCFSWAKGRKRRLSADGRGISASPTTCSFPEESRTLKCAGITISVDVLVYPRFAMRLTETVTPLKPLEAMAMGKLLVASNVGGHRELIRDGETGILFEAGNASDLVRKILLALDDEELGRTDPDPRAPFRRRGADMGRKASPITVRSTSAW